MGLECSKCGINIENIPLQCGLSMTINNETNKWECDMIGKSRFYLLGRIWEL